MPPSFLQSRTASRQSFEKTIIASNASRSAAVKPRSHLLDQARSPTLYATRPDPKKPHDFFGNKLPASITTGCISSSQCSITRQLSEDIQRNSLSHLLRTMFSGSTVWWSQTGSNRRPHACKARALPTELWPHLAIEKTLASARRPSFSKTCAASEPRGSHKLISKVPSQRR